MLRKGRQVIINSKLLLISELTNIHLARRPFLKMLLLYTYILSFVFLLSKTGVKQEILVFWINIRIVAVKALHH